MSRPAPPLPDVLVRALLVGLVVGLVDLALGVWRRGPEPFPAREALEALRLATGAATLAYLVLWLVASGPRVALGLHPGALAMALAACLLVAVVDADLVRWDRIRAHPLAIHASLERGLLALVLVYVVLVRGPLKDAGPPAAEPAARGHGTVPVALAVLGQVAVLVAPDLAPAGAAAEPPRPVRSGHRVPRVLLVVVDTLRADALSYRSPDAPPTPAIDRLAARSHAFTHARSPGAWTLPSVASLLTGVSPLVHGAVTRFSALPDAVPTLAEALAADGYRTAAIGHNFVLSETRRLDRGFDTYRFDRRHGAGLRSLGVLPILAERRAQHRPERTAEEINERAFAWLEEHRDEDFFLWLHYYDPHLVYEPPVDLRPEGEPPPGRGYRFGHDHLEPLRAGYEVPDADGRRWIRALYDAEVRAVDRALGALFAKLEELGLYEDTLIVLTSDHGEEFWEHGGFEHGHSVHREVVDVPLLVKLPGQSQGTRIATPVSLENVAPSVLALCGLAPDETRTSASPLFDPAGSPVAAPRLPGVSSGTCYYEDRAAVSWDRWRYVSWSVTDREELYDVRADPEERHSLAASLPEVLAEGRRRLEAARAEARELRERLGVRGDSAVELDAGELDALQQIGYAAGSE